MAKADLKLGCKYTRKALGEDIRAAPKRIEVLILPQKNTFQPMFLNYSEKCHHMEICRIL